LLVHLPLLSSPCTIKPRRCAKIRLLQRLGFRSVAGMLAHLQWQMEKLMWHALKIRWGGNGCRFFGAKGKRYNRLVIVFEIPLPSRHHFRKGGIRNFLQAGTLLIAKHPYDILKIVYSLCNTASNNMAMNQKCTVQKPLLYYVIINIKCCNLLDMLNDMHAQFIQLTH